MQIKPLPLLRLKGMTLSTILVPMLEIEESTKNKPCSFTFSLVFHQSRWSSVHFLKIEDAFLIIIY